MFKCLWNIHQGRRNAELYLQFSVNVKDVKSFRNGSIKSN